MSNAVEGQLLIPRLRQRGHVAELADAPDLESGGETRGGSSPLLPKVVG
jgi:hypothetical protein